MLLGILIAALAIGGLYVRRLAPDERVDLYHRVLATVRHARPTFAEPAPEFKAFVEMLRQRTRRAVVTPALLGLNGAIFVVMLFGSGALSAPGTLIDWGGSFGPRTTNGEWWRLVTAMFVHSGPLHLAADVAGLLWMGFLLERLVGPVAFAATYLTAGMLVGTADLSTHEAAVHVGASGAIFGIYGLFAALMISGLVTRSKAMIPLSALKIVAPGAAVFLLYDLVAFGDGEARFVGFAAGLASGLLLAMGLAERKPPARRIATVAIASLVIAVTWAAPIRGLSDATTLIGQVVAAEHRTARDYDTARDRFNAGRGTMKERIDLIERIRPELQALRAQVQSVGKVPREQQLLLANAIEYLKTRDESWRMRAEALRKGDMRMLREADRMEQVSLNAFGKIGPAGVQ